jgi:sigma-B regulation protein RsbQ
MRPSCLALVWVLIVVLGCQSSELEEVTPASSVWQGSVSSFDDVLVSYAVEGEGSPALVLIHCWACDRGYWSGQVPELAGYYQVVTLDLPGHGEAGGNRSDWSVQTYGEDVRAVVEALELDEVILVGHSMGGPVALEAARLLPERTLGIVAVETLQDASTRPDPERWQGWIASYEEDFVGTCTGFVKTLFPEGTAPGLVAETTDDMCAAPPEIATALLRGFGSYGTAAAMEAVEAPIRAINGSLFPTNVEGNRALAADYDAVIMEGVGHFPMLEQPQEFNRLLGEAVSELAGTGQP